MSFQCRNALKYTTDPYYVKKQFFRKKKQLEIYYSKVFM